MGDILKDNYAILNRKEHELNRDVSKKNLLDFRKVLMKHGIKFCLAFGTLLGAVRDSDFIDGDDDTDIIVLHEDRGAVLEILPDLIRIGFEVIRSDDFMVSIMRGGDFIDIFFYKKSIFGYRYNNWFHIKSEYVEDMEWMYFLDKSFRIPKDHTKFLELTYGANWRTPSDEHGNLFGTVGKTVRYIKKVLHIKRILPRRNIFKYLWESILN